VSFIVLVLYLILNVLLAATYSSWKQQHSRQLLCLRAQRYHNLLVAWELVQQPHQEYPQQHQQQQYPQQQQQYPQQHRSQQQQEQQYQEQHRGQLHRTRHQEQQERQRQRQRQAEKSWAVMNQGTFSALVKTVRSSSSTLKGRGAAAAAAAAAVGASAVVHILKRW